MSSNGTPVCNSSSSVLVPNSPAHMCCWYTTQLSIAIQYTGNSYLHQHILYSCLRASSCLLLDSPNVHPHLKKKSKKDGKFQPYCKCIALLIEHWWSALDFNLAGTTASKESTRCVMSTCAGNTKRKIIKFELLIFLLWWLGLWFLSCRS